MGSEPLFYTELAPDEALPLGTFTSESSETVNGVTRTTKRKVAITNRRVIFETKGDRAATRVVQLDEVVAVIVTRKRVFGAEQTTIEAIRTKTGETLPVGMALLDAATAASLPAVFPGAAIEGGATAPDPPKRRGLLGWLGIGGGR